MAAMPRGLDHIVHAVRDLDAAAELYRGLGFTVGSRNRHPWGTHNHIVQLPGFFIELLTLAEPDKLGDDGFSKLFGAYNGDFLARGEGLSLLILESKDARADAAAFRAAGIAGSDVMRFEREGKRPDGTAVKVGFSLAFADDKRAADIHFCICQQHFPENFWNPAFQKHANTVSGVAGVVAVADEPEQHRAFMQAFAGAQATTVKDGFSIATPRGTIDLMTPAAFVARFGVKVPDTARSARLAAIRFAVADAGLLQTLPELAGIARLYAGNAAIIGADDAMGAVMVFESSR
jgi:catechol 2,3-dioxygenase-like lactoylglutathione lyase family enzyme